MRAGAIVSGVLGAGTALVFALAALTATLFPNGTIVSSGLNPMMDRGWVNVAPAMPVPAPFVIQGEPDVFLRGDGTGGGVVVPDGFEALPGDIVDTEGANGVEFQPAP
jgi:hypothetical protein